MEEWNMIAEVICKNQKYYVFDESGEEISHDMEISMGKLLGFSDVIMVFLKNGKYYSYDEGCKEIAHDFESSLGDFRYVVGPLVSFRKGANIYIRNRFFEEISHRREWNIAWTLIYLNKTMGGLAANGVSLSFIP